MHTPHVTAGGRYPVLRTLGILYMIGAVGLLCYGVYRIVRTLFLPVGLVADRITLALLIFGLTALAVIGALLAAELIKLLIDVEHNTRAGAPPTTATAPADDESAEAALFRGH
jgi:hypothetical protein